MRYRQYFEKPDQGKVICGLKNDDHDSVYEIENLDLDASIDDFYPMHISFYPVENMADASFECGHCAGSFEFSQSYVQAISGKLPNWKPVKVNIFPDHIHFECFEVTENRSLYIPGGDVYLRNPEVINVRIELEGEGSEAKEYRIHKEDGKMLVDEFRNQILLRTSVITEEYELITEN